MTKIDRAELIAKGYTEAEEWDRGFGTGYAWPILLLAITFFSAFLFLDTHMDVALLVICGSLLTIVVLWCFFRHSRPVSPITGKRLTAYRSGDSWDSEGNPIAEVVYVDHDSRKFFRHVFIKTGGDIGGD